MGIENIDYKSIDTSSSYELSSSQKEYLQELFVSPKEWVKMSDLEKSETGNSIKNRILELAESENINPQNIQQFVPSHLLPDGINEKTSSKGEAAIENLTKLEIHEDKYIEEAKDFEEKIKNGKDYNEKIDNLYALRKHLEEIKEINPELNEKCFQSLDENTQKALDELNERSPYPNKNVTWSGKRGDSTCSVDSTHPKHKELKELDATSCDYENGNPVFDKHVYPGSRVDMSNDYPKYTNEELSKRGGSRNSLQEVAQRRMAEQLEPTIKEWWDKNFPREKFDLEKAFYKWRDAHNLVPHEDADGKSMYLLPRTIHETYKHRGGIANVKLINNYFPEKKD